jgi:hypothetical protein
MTGTVILRHCKVPHSCRPIGKTFLIVPLLAYLLECIAHAEAGWQTAQWKILKGLDECTDEALRGDQEVNAPEHPLLIIPTIVGFQIDHYPPTPFL